MKEERILTLSKMSLGTPELRDIFENVGMIRRINMLSLGEIRLEKGNSMDLLLDSRRPYLLVYGGSPESRRRTVMSLLMSVRETTQCVIEPTVFDDDLSVDFSSKKPNLIPFIKSRMFLPSNSYSRAIHLLTIEMLKRKTRIDEENYLDICDTDNPPCPILWVSGRNTESVASIVKDGRFVNTYLIAMLDLQTLDHPFVGREFPSSSYGLPYLLNSVKYLEINGVQNTTEF